MKLTVVCLLTVQKKLEIDKYIILDVLYNKNNTLEMYTFAFYQVGSTGVIKYIYAFRYVL